MKRWDRLLCWTAAACLGLLQPAALASGSAGPGNSKVNARGAYTAGKALVFRELVCSRCPTQRSEFDRDRARDLKTALVGALEGPAQDWSRDLRALCTGAAEPLDRCAARVKFVITYLDRRYRL